MNLVLEFMKHNTMMNERVMDACSQLDPGQLDATVGGTYGSIGATLVHIANSQESYAARFLGTTRGEQLQEDPFPGFETLGAAVRRGNAGLEQSASEVTEEGHVEVSGDDPPGTWSMNRGLLLLQAVNHGTEHRSQVATILTRLGIEPPRMDGWGYFFAAGHMIDV